MGAQALFPLEHSLHYLPLRGNANFFYIKFWCSSHECNRTRCIHSVRALGLSDSWVSKFSHQNYFQIFSEDVTSPLQKTTSELDIRFQRNFMLHSIPRKSWVPVLLHGSTMRTAQGQKKHRTCALIVLILECTPMIVYCIAPRHATSLSIRQNSELIVLQRLRQKTIKKVCLTKSYQTLSKKA